MQWNTKYRSRTGGCRPKPTDSPCSMACRVAATAAGTSAAHCNCQLLRNRRRDPQVAATGKNRTASADCNASTVALDCAWFVDGVDKCHSLYGPT